MNGSPLDRWFNQVLAAHARRQPARKPATTSLQLEALLARALPSVSAACNPVPCDPCQTVDVSCGQDQVNVCDNSVRGVLDQCGQPQDDCTPPPSDRTPPPNDCTPPPPPKCPPPKPDCGDDHDKHTKNCDGGQKHDKDKCDSEGDKDHGDKCDGGDQKKHNDDCGSDKKHNDDCGDQKKHNDDCGNQGRGGCKLDGLKELARHGC